MKRYTKRLTKQEAIELIKKLEDPHFHFEEKVIGEDTIGYADDNDRHMEVRFLEDNLGQYISLKLHVKKEISKADALMYLTRWIVNGRFEGSEDGIVISSTFPILDTSFIGKQMDHALIEMWDMNNIIRNTPEKTCPVGKNR